MTIIKSLFLEGWIAKLTSLLIATAIWYLIKSHLDGDNKSFPVPGTESTVPVRSSSVPGLEESILSPLTPPVPGNKAN